MTDKTKRDKILARVAKLIAQAESTEFSDERDAFREKADTLMLEYAIQEAELAAAGDTDSRINIVKKTDVNVAAPNSPFREALADLFWATAEHCRCKGITFGYQMKNSYPITGTLVGTEADVQYAEMLFNSLRLQLANELEPKYDHSMSMEDNVYVMRNAGIKWNRLEQLCGLGPYGPAQRAYKKACADRGEEPRTRLHPRSVQRNFAEAYVQRVALRFRELKRRQEETHDAGAALVPVRDAVQEAMEEFFPKMKQARPKQRGKFDRMARSRGDAAGQRADLGQHRVRQTPQIG